MNTLGAISSDLFLTYDLPAMLTGTLAALCCGLLGNMLVLRRLSLMGDAISHAVLPGLVVAFLITEMRTSLPMFIGAAIAGILTVVLVEVVRKLGRVESGAAMGVVFSILFALGVVLIERAARQVDLDANCVLNGSLEQVFMLDVSDWGSFLAPSEWHLLPRQLLTLTGATVLSVLFIALLFKELRITGFDPALATSLGFNSSLVHYLYMIVVAIAVVASFEAVGSILVIAMLICPAATARLLTDRFLWQFIISGIVALISGVVGYLLGPLAPQVLGIDTAINAAGMMTLVGGAILALAVLFAPAHGLIAQRVRRLRLAVAVALEDLLGMLYRAEELEADDEKDVAVTFGGIRIGDAQRALGGGLTAWLAMRQARAAGLVTGADGVVQLNDSGRARGRSVVRSHRLWESWLVERLGLRPDHVHRTAMGLEHITTPQMQDELATAAPTERDPHDRPIPEAGAVDEHRE